ncbi:unnamed protein product [Ilex paraguariensis]|uniref:HMA domain-containing protein n=2 Tax=Ilex paraguariensis TaxID=185542 RepID=A0ABC8TFL0_9AQUA
MGEEQKKLEEKNPEEKKPEEGKKPGEEKREDPKSEKPSDGKGEEKKGEEPKDGKDSKDPPPPPPPQEIVLRVFMHCEGCARKVRRCLKGFEGVEDVETDCKTHKVVVKGEKADPLKVLERVQKKSHRQVELLTPIPKPPADEPKKVEEKEIAKPEQKTEEPQVITAVLKVHMHCEACSQVIKKRIERMKGVESAEPDLKSSQVTVKGALEPQNLVEYIHKRTGKQAVIVKVDPEKKEGEDKAKEEKKGEEKDDKKVEEESKEKKKEAIEEAAKAAAAAAAAEGEEPEPIIELKKNEYRNYYPHNFQLYHQGFTQEYYAFPPPPPQIYIDGNPNAYPPQIFSDENPNAYHPQIFSDENPNACSVM